MPGANCEIKMEYVNTTFAERVQRLNKKDKAMPNGLGTTVNCNGESVICKRKTRDFNPRRGLAIIMLVFFGMKGMFYEQLGPITYSGRISSLEQGVLIERWGAKLMQADPVTLWVSEQIGKLRGPSNIGNASEQKPSIWAQMFSQNNLEASVGSLKSTLDK